MLETHLRHLLWLLEPPFTEGWRRYVWARAQELADANPDLADLPSALTEAMRSRQKAAEPPSAPI